MRFPWTGAVLFGALLQPVLGTLRRFELNITSAYLNPDCHEELFPSLLVNDQFPAPTLRMVKGDDVEVIVFNSLTELNLSTTVHFHGIRQYGTVESDGVPDVTQEAILPGEMYTYRFRVMDQSGTFFYHAHVGLQDDTLQGPLIVHDNMDSWPDNEGGRLMDAGYEYDAERTLQLSEWWHESFQSREHYYMSSRFIFDKGADAIFMNGRTIYHGQYGPVEKAGGWGGGGGEGGGHGDAGGGGGGGGGGWGEGGGGDGHGASGDAGGGDASGGSGWGGQPSTALAARQEMPDSCPGYSVLEMQPGKTYRLRIIGAQTFRTLGFAIGGGHRMTIIEVDGQITKPYETDWLEIGPGQRFSVLIETHKGKDGDVVPIATSYRWRHRSHSMYTENGFAYLRYSQDASCTHQEACGYPTLYKPVIPPPPPGDDKKGHGKRDEHEYTPDLPIFPMDNKRDWLWPEIEPLRAEKHGSERLDTQVILNSSADRLLKLRAGQQELPNNETRYLMNGRMPAIRQKPVLTDLMQGRLAMPATDSMSQIDGYSPSHQTFPIQAGEVVDIVLQNVKAGPSCLIHPWHTHGHSHYQIASGPGEYDHSTDADIRNYPTPLYRDVSMVYPDEELGPSDGCGWTKLRLFADNPGLWAIHCHITAHMMQGKFAVLEESPELIASHRLYK